MTRVITFEESEDIINFRKLNNLNERDALKKIKEELAKVLKLEQWDNILNVAKLSNSNESDIIKKIKEKLKEENGGEYEKWKEANFDVNYHFNVGFEFRIDKFTLLHFAAYNGHTETVNALIKAGVNVHAKSEKKQTPLHWAAKTGRTGAISALLAAGANIDAIDDKGKTPLYLAAENEHTDAVNALVEAGADINAIDLYWAAKNGYTDVINALLAAGVDDVDGDRDYDRNTPLHLAAKNGHTDIVNALLIAGANIYGKNCRGQTPLSLAAIGNHTDAINALVAAGVSQYRKTPLYDWDARWDAKNNHKDAINEALSDAAYYGQTNAVIALLEAGADVDAKDGFDNTSLYLAASNGHLDVVKVLIKAGADVNHKNWYSHQRIPLHPAAENGHLDVVKVLIEKGANIHEKDKDRSTPLLLAARNSHTDVINALLAAGADVGAGNRDYDRNTPLHLAAENGYTDAINALVAVGADVHARSDFERTPLHLAAENGHTDAINALVAVGADVHARSDFERTPLHLAAKNGHTDAISALLVAGANIHEKDEDRRTPLYLAVNMLHESAAKFLTAHEIKLQGSNAQKPEYPKHLVQNNSIFTREMSEYWDRCLGEYKKLEKEDKLLHDFLNEGDTSTLVSIWEKNEDICSKFDNQESLQRQYPEYAHTLINKANKAKKEVFLHNHKPLIDVLAEYYEHDFYEMEFTDIKAFFQEYKDNIVLELGAIEKHLINFLDFKNIKKVHVPRLELCAFAEVIKNKSNSSSKHQTIDQSCSSSVDEQVPDLAIETTGTIEHISASDSEVSSELESNGNQQSTQPEFLTINGHSSNIASEGNSTKILVSDQENDIQNNNKQPSSDDAPQSEKRTIVAASTLAIAGVALGIAIAVHLEMLAIGAAVGACCLVAAAVIHYCNSPASSLKECMVPKSGGMGLV